LLQAHVEAGGDEAVAAHRATVKLHIREGVVSVEIESVGDVAVSGSPPRRAGRKVVVAYWCCRLPRRCIPASLRRGRGCWRRWSSCRGLQE
jgi:hypothetical protein